jgi:hypothetical protein
MPEIHDGIDGITNVVALFLRNRKWRVNFYDPNARQAVITDEREALSKPLSALLARRPKLQAMAKQFTAPIVLIGLVAGYIWMRLEDKRPTPAIASTPTAAATQRAVQVEVTRVQADAQRVAEVQAATQRNNVIDVDFAQPPANPEGRNPFTAEQLAAMNAVFDSTAFENQAIP